MKLYYKQSNLFEIFRKRTELLAQAKFDEPENHLFYTNSNVIQYINLSINKVFMQ